jgi:hypothetical protein
MRLPTVWKNCAHQPLHNVLKEVMGGATVALSHENDQVKSIDVPDKVQHELSCTDSLLDCLRDVAARCAPFRRMMKVQSKPTLITSTNLRNLLSSWASIMDSHSR